MDHTIVVRIMLGIYIICNYSELGEGQQKTQLSACSDTATPPCVLKPMENEAVCRGQNVSASVTLKLLQSMTQDVTVGNIGVYRGSDRIIIGFSKNPSFSGEDRWEVSHMISATEDKSCLVTVTLHVNDVQLDDDFESHVEIQLGDQILSTSDEIWFKVNNYCSDQLDKVKGPEEPDKHDYSNAPLPESTKDTLSGIKDLIKNLTLSAHNPGNKVDIRTDDIAILINKNTTMTIILLVIVVGIVCFMLYRIVKSCYKRWKIKKVMSALRDSIENAIKEEVQKMDQLLGVEKVEQRKKKENIGAVIQLDRLEKLKQKSQMMADFLQSHEFEKIREIPKTDLLPTMHIVNEGTSHKEEDDALLERTKLNGNEITKAVFEILHPVLVQKLQESNADKLCEGHRLEHINLDTENTV